MEQVKANADTLFEVSWEVANKVGGINTVIISKIEQIMCYYKNYFLIGPYFEDKWKEEVESKIPPRELQPALKKLQEQGIICHYGKWLVKGEPDVLLVEYLPRLDDKDEIKKILYEKYRIDSLKAGWEFDEPAVWSWTVGKVIEEICNFQPDKKAIAHFHEWMSGIGLLYLKHKNSNIKTVFTTHATILGRSIAGMGRPLYEELNYIDVDKEAYFLNIPDKHQTEKACAQKSDIFTTVSEITQMEAEKILGRKAEVLVLNGLDISKFPTIEETSVKHVQNREVIREFLSYHFFPYYTFELEHNLNFFILGRYEFKNKGLDIMIEALGKLNKKLIEENSNRTVTALFFIPMQTTGMKMELLENKNVFRHITTLVKTHSKPILKGIIKSFLSQKNPTEEILSKEFIYEIRKDILHFKRNGNPLLTTHNIYNEDQDAILNALRYHGLDNKEDDKVKAVLYPVYINGEDGVTDLPNQYEMLAGCHLGVFPSYYEPWGYTPLEAAAMGVCSVTSDLSGFGRFMEPKLMKEDPGIFILKRHKVKWQDQVESLTNIFLNYCNMDHAQRVQNKINAKYITNLTDWKHLVKNYIKAHNLALVK